MKNVKDIGCWIPPEVLSRKDLSSNEKLIAGRVLGLSMKTGYCYASNKWLGEQFGLSGGSVSNIVSALVKKNVISREVIRNERKQIIQRKLYPVSTEKWIPINGKVEDSMKDISIKVNNNNGFSEQKSKVRNTDTVLNHLKKNPSDSENVNLAIEYYVKKYVEVCGKPHPRITDLQFETVKEGFLNPQHDDLYDLDIDTFSLVIDNWFADENVKSDYNIIHFASGRVILQHFIQECGYIE